MDESQCASGNAVERGSAMKVVGGIEGAISFTGWSPVMAAAQDLGRESGSPSSFRPAAAP